MYLRLPTSEHRMNESAQQDIAIQFKALAAREKLHYMHAYAKTSTIATILAPLLCIPLYIDSTDVFLFHAWFVLMAAMVIVRFFLIRAISHSDDVERNLMRLNIAVGIVTFVWGLGWFIFVPTSEPVEYLLYQIISLTVLFVGMVGYCVNWKTFFAFVLPLKTPELIYIVFHHEVIIWPIALGSMVALYLALKMGFLFSKSWEKSFSLRLRNDALVDQLIAEKNASIEANIAKSEFIATASHDLRQPMQAINIFIEMIEQKNLKAYEKSIFERMHSSVAVLNKMFNTLLDISKLDSNFSTTETHFSLSQMVGNLRHTFEDLCQQKKLGLIFKGEQLTVKGDPQLTEQLLRNLLSNAVQYTDSGEIVITFGCEAGCLVFSVADSGCGIPPEDLSLVFNEFYRSEHSRSRYDGLGLGLSIVNRIVKKIDGQCQVQSAVGQGSTFTIHTSYRVSDEQAKQPLKPANALSMAHNALTETALAPCIGIIENDLSLREAYRQYFKQKGCQVYLIPHQEVDFFEFLLDLPKLQFILSDFRLGERNGIYFIQKLREEFNDDIPACILTADTSPKHLELFSAHNIDVLYKPIDIKEIATFVSSAMRQAH
jgi:signal transduction histidine kinase/CheY-like chemotaxis protein